MSGFSILAIVAVAAAAIGFLLKRNGELAGLGEGTDKRGFRHPHGRLVRTKRLDAIEPVPFLSKFARVAAVCFALNAVLLALCAFGVFDLGEPYAASIGCLATIAVGLLFAQHDLSAWRFAAYSIIGYFVGALIGAFPIGYGLLSAVVPPTAALVNGLTMGFGALGTAVGVSLAPVQLSYAREFEDGHIDSLQVSAMSKAARMFDALADDAWQPPKDRVAGANVPNNLRKEMRKRDTL